MADESHVTLKSLNGFTDLFHMLIRFWCDSDITFSRGLHKKKFSIIIVLCGAGEDASFAPQANLVSNSHNDCAVFNFLHSTLLSEMVMTHFLLHFWTL